MRISRYVSLTSVIPDAMVYVKLSHQRGDEQTIIKPALEALGYTNIRFIDGDRDSYGPLTRIVIAVRAHGKTEYFIYGQTPHTAVIVAVDTEEA